VDVEEVELAGPEEDQRHLEGGFTRGGDEVSRHPDGARQSPLRRGHEQSCGLETVGLACEGQLAPALDHGWGGGKHGGQEETRKGAGEVHADSERGEPYSGGLDLER
jgi:hypothetical protein